MFLTSKRWIAAEEHGTRGGPWAFRASASSEASKRSPVDQRSFEGQQVPGVGATGLRGSERFPTVSEGVSESLTGSLWWFLTAHKWGVLNEVGADAVGGNSPSSFSSLFQAVLQGVPFTVV